MKLEEILLESGFTKLQNNKVELSKEEKKEVIQKKAIWSDGRSAIWKSIDKVGKEVFITHTHRAYQVRPTLKGAISIFHSFIKGTS